MTTAPEAGPSPTSPPPPSSVAPSSVAPSSVTPSGLTPAGLRPSTVQRAGDLGLPGIDPEAEVTCEEVEAAEPPPVPPGSRREARETALILLYEAESRGESPAQSLAGQVVPPPDYTITLVEGVSEHGADIDAMLVRFARGWRIERMPTIDRCVLRLGAYELTHRPEVPTGVVLSETVDLASRYSTDDSGRFVNGLLAALAAEVRKP
jgi:N utilization substance protein B